MKKLSLSIVFALFSLQLLDAEVTRERDIVYQRSEGVALTMDVFRPENPNGIGIIKIVSGGWKSRHDRVGDDYSSPYTDEGYTVFAVFHGSQPRYKVRDIMGFMHRAVRFIRTHANRWDIDPVDRASSAVQAVGVFYPPTDYLNWAEPGDEAVGIGKQARWQPAFGPESETAEGRQTLGRAMSSLYHISEKTPPITIMHGDSDKIVPLFQSESFKKIADTHGVPVELVVKKDGGHGWPNRIADEVQFLNWFNERLLD